MELDNNTTNTINNNQTIFAINNNVINNVGDRLDYNEAVQIPLPFRRNVAQNGSRLDDSNHQEDIEILYQDIANLGGFIVNNQYDETTDQDLNNSQAPLSPRSIAQELKSSLNTRGSPIYANSTITNISRPTSSDSSIENDYKLLAAASPNFSNTSPQPSSQQSPFTASDSACSSVGPYLAFYGSDETNTKTTTTASNDFYLNESKMPKSPKTVKKRKTSSSSSMSSSPPSSLVPQKLPLRDHQENMIVDSRANKRPNTAAISSNLEDALGREELRLDNLTLKQEAIQYFDEYAANGGISGALNQKSNRTIVFNNWNESNWVNLFSNDYKLIPRPDFKVEADKGFSYSIFDEAFVCQKKNHFQITAYTFVESQPFYCRKTTTSSDEYHEISSFRLRLYGVKEESPKQTIEIRKSDSDRKPLEFEPPEYPMMGGVENKLTQMRLHFAHTTSNNNRKRDMKSGRVVPNPDQRYFLLVVELEAVTTTGLAFCVCSAASERVIVRAVNPGQFRPRESSIDEVSQADVDLSIPKTSPAILAAACAEASQITTFQGKVGINTLNPEEALSVIGNIKLSGLILQPSDMRIKENIKPVDPNNALEKLKKIKIYKYDFKQEFVDINGGVKSDMGVLAQEVREIIPEAVVETRDVQLSNGEVVEKFLHVDKNRLHMECMGAVIALEDKTQHLNKKIDYLENRFPIDSNVSSSKNANNKDKNSKNIFKNCNPKRVKLIISIAAILIALGVLGILIVEILRHINEKQKSAAPNNSTNNHGGNPYYYPLISPPVFGQAVCNSSFLAPGRPRPSCTQYCCPQDNDMSTTGMYSTTSSTRPSLSSPAKKIVFPNFNIQFNMSDIRATGISSVGVLGLGLYVADPLLFINLAFNGMCTLPYCEQIDGINFIFVPISSTIDVETDIFVVFIMKNGYWVRFCNYDQNGNECHELSTGQTTPAQMPTNIQRTNYSLYSQNVFQTSVSKFLHIDFTFRTVNDASANACVMNDTSNLNSNVRFQEYIIRFYRIC